MDDNERREILRQDALRQGALVVLLSRAGGSAGYTEAEYQEICARYGGTKNLAIHIEVLKRPADEKPDEVRLTLIRKAPENAELVS